VDLAENEGTKKKTMGLQKEGVKKANPGGISGSEDSRHNRSERFLTGPFLPAAVFLTSVIRRIAFSE
jgi:hypothetical protein